MEKIIPKKIIVNVQKNNLLRIICYNKKFQSILNVDINDYKNEYNKIEIEIIPLVGASGNFFNINQKNKSGYHIFFNDNKEEIKIEKQNNYINKNDKIKKINLILDYKIKTIEGLFSNCKAIKKISFIKFKRKDFDNMSYMFNKCFSLEEINFANFNTDNVTNMSHMFNKCLSLNEINLYNFNTDKVTNMSYMFYRCTRLIKLNLSHFNTDNVTDMSCMFFGCSLLDKLNLSNFNTNNIEYMEKMIEECPNLKELNCSDTSVLAQYLKMISCIF